MNFSQRLRLFPVALAAVGLLAGVAQAAPPEPSPSLVSFQVKNMAGAATLTLDGEPLGVIEVGKKALDHTFAVFPLPVGEHTVVATSGDKTVELELTVADGEAIFVEVRGWSPRLVSVASRTPTGSFTLGGAEGKTGTLVVESAQPGTVYVDGARHKLKPADGAPAVVTLTVPAGPSYVRAMLDGSPFLRQAQGVVVGAGETVKVTVRPGAVELDAPQVASWATVKVESVAVDGLYNLVIDGVIVGQIMRDKGTKAFEPIVMRLPPGTHQVQVVGALSLASEGPLTLGEGDSVTLALGEDQKLVEKERTAGKPTPTVKRPPTLRRPPKRHPLRSPNPRPTR